MKQLENWFLSNNLIINTGKTKAILFQGNGCSSIHRPSLYLNNKEITYTSNLKFLGIHITDNLNWSTHIQYLCQKLNKVLCLIKSLRDSVSKPILRNIYFTKFESILRYGIIFWGGVNYSNAVFIIQKKFLYHEKVNNRVSCRNLFGDLKILTVTSLYIFEILCYIKKEQIYTTQYLDIHNYNTRGKQDLYVQLCSTSCKKSVIYMGIKLHNLPTEIKK
jgi:hypothetical protein